MSKTYKLVLIVLTVVIFLAVIKNAEPAKASEIKYVNSEEGLVLRKSPTIKGTKILTIPYGEQVDFLYDTNDWAKVKYSDETGYVKAEYLQDEDIHEGMELLGEFEITAYAATGNPCANGNYPQTGYTVACNSLDFGTRIFIDGVGERVVEDRGGSYYSDNWLDLYLGDTASCYQWGVQNRNVWLIKDE